MPINLSDAANHSMGDVPSTAGAELAAAAAGCCFVQQDCAPLGELLELEQPASSGSAATTEDAAMVIGEGGLSAKGTYGGSSGDVSSGTSIRDMTRMASCSSSSTIAQLAAGRSVASVGGRGDAAATGISGVQPTWVVRG